MTFTHPVPGPISSPYGWRTIRGVPNFHNGLDWHWLKAAPVTSRQVRAPFAGRVTVGRRSDLGLYVTIVSGDFSMRLAHLESASVKTGDTIAVMQHVGVMGNSGFAIGVHLHADLFVKGVRVDPAPYFTKPHTTLTLAGSAPTNIDTEMEDDMRLVQRTGSATPEWSLFHPSLAGPSDLQRGYYVITDPDEALAWARLLYKGAGSEQSEPRDVYVTLQAVARTAHANYRRGVAVGGTADLTPLLTAIGGVPTAAQNGAAARAAIVK